MNKQKAEQTAKQIADQINGPLGRVPMERVFAQHLEFFEELKALGATWPQIASLLDEAGIRRKDGKVLTAAQLRATISRQTESKTTPSIPKDLPQKTPLPTSFSIPMHETQQTSNVLRQRMKIAKKHRT